MAPRTPGKVAAGTVDVVSRIIRQDNILWMFQTISYHNMYHVHVLNKHIFLLFVTSVDWQSKGGIFSRSDISAR